MERVRGFTLIELMSVVAIMGLLATIVLSAYLAYIAKAANRACMMEVRHYVSEAMVALNTPDATIPQPPDIPGSACAEITPATDLNTPVVGQLSEKYGGGSVICDIPTTSCSFE